MDANECESAPPGNRSYPRVRLQNAAREALTRRAADRGSSLCGREVVTAVILARFFGATGGDLRLIEYGDAPPIRAVYDDIMSTRKTDWVNNFWKALAHDPAALRRTWETAKQVMGPGSLDPLTKEMLYVAISMSNQCDYCVASHISGARSKGMT
jgi:AhpD family alkylhydroperoxidase